ncbi:MAG: ABC transporter permease [Gemmatimonas sp.]
MRAVSLRFVGAMSENVRMAVEALRANKLRSSLTILGVVIGVATVMAMAAIVEGIRRQIVNTIEVAGPTTLYVMKKFSQTPLNPDNLPKDVRIRPDVNEREAERLRQLPEIGYASLWAQVFARIEFDGVRSQPMAIFGADDGFARIQGGELLAGRWFTRSELLSGAPVLILQERVATRMFGRERAVGRRVRIGGRPAEVIGVWEEPSNIFAPPGSEVGGVVPYRMLDHQFDIDRTNALWIPVKPRNGVRVADAQSAVVMTIRESRRLRPGDGNTFDIITQDQVLDTFNNFTGIFFLVMIVLSSVALLVGGIGVMAIMTVSVTSRTREIGVRMALGATRGDILSQFLVEAATLTGIGGAIGIAVGLGFARVASVALDVNTPVPMALTVVAVAVSVSIGLVFGLVPARRASRLDPIDALRHE